MEVGPVVKEKGIVLKKYLPKKNKLCIFDYSLGKIFCITGIKNAFDKIAAGFLVEYSRTAYNMLYSVESLEIINAPFIIAKNDIFFLHHVLELCYYFIPENCSSKQIFDLIYFLLNFAQISEYPLYKKIFLMRLFAYIGMYPQDERLQSSCVYQLLYGPLDTAHDSLILSKDEHKALNYWLLDCINIHPQRNQFKTIILGQGDDKL